VCWFCSVFSVVLCSVVVGQRTRKVLSKSVTRVPTFFSSRKNIF